MSPGIIFSDDMSSGKSSRVPRWTLFPGDMSSGIAETTKDLNEWKATLEEALPDAPTASHTVGMLRRKDDQSQSPYRGVVAVYQ
ncbi:hypothetical protein Tco_0780716 [Tanacetum coccineum]